MATLLVEFIDADKAPCDVPELGRIVETWIVSRDNSSSHDLVDRIYNILDTNDMTINIEIKG